MAALLSKSLSLVEAALITATPSLKQKIAADPDYKFLQNSVNVIGTLANVTSVDVLRKAFFDTAYYRMLSITNKEKYTHTTTPIQIALMNYYVKEQAFVQKYAKYFDASINKGNIKQHRFPDDVDQYGGGLSTGAIVGIVIAGMVVFFFVIMPAFLIWSNSDGGGVTRYGGAALDNLLCSKLMKLQNISGLTLDNVKTICRIIQISKTPYWDCTYCLLKLVRQRKQKTDCQNVEAVIQWAELLKPNNLLVKRLRKYKDNMEC